ncbi:MAG: serine hydrolase, partial [Alphaproteobacteria bacterium]
FLAQANRARPHVRGGGGWVVGPQRQPDAQSPAGGVTSSVRDVAQWLRLQLGDGTVDGRRILAADALAEMQRPQIISGRPRDPKSDMASFYGLGLNVGYDARGRVRLGHSGAFLMGAATVVEMAPGDRLGIAVLTNAIPMGVPEAIARSFIEIVQDGAASREWIAVLGPAFAAMMAPTYGTAIDYTVVPAASTPPLAGAYAGRYASDLYGPIEVAETSAGAVLRIGPGPTEYRLVHFDRDVFTWQPPGENAYGPSAVSFAVGADRRAASVTIENLDAHGQGTFARVVASR